MRDSISLQIFWSRIIFQHEFKTVVVVRAELRKLTILIYIVRAMLAVKCANYIHLDLMDIAKRHIKFKYLNKKA